jgi:hypothetical protein
MNRDTVACRALVFEDIPAAVILRIIARSQRDLVTGCLLWLGAQNEDGYGRIQLHSRPNTRFAYVHRIAAAIALGHVPDDREVHHTCHRRNCMEPDHLKLVTGPENEALVAEDGQVPF